MNRENITLNAKIIAKDTEELYDIARSKGINMPHPALGIFQSTLCEIEKANGNRIRLGKKATEEAVSTLIGTQINRNHDRYGSIFGHTIDAKINKDQIDIVCIFFKDIYAEEWEIAKELFKKNELTMSFELSADIASQDKLSDGTKRLNDYYFTGAGLLFGVKPACKKARVFEMATQKLSDQLNMERQSLIFANNQRSQKSIMEVIKLMADEVKKLEEAKVEEIQAETLPETPVVTSEAPIEASAPIVEPKAEEVVAQPEVPKEVVIVTETTQVVTDTFKENSETIKVETETVKKIDDVVKEERKEMVEVTYTYAQMEAVKAEYEQKISTLNEQLANKEIQIENLKLVAEKMVTRKAELKDNEFCKDFTDEDYLNDAKIEEAVCKQQKKKKLMAVKDELKDNEFAKDFSDEDYLNQDKVENATLKKQLVSKKVSEPVVASDNLLSTGHREDLSSEKKENPVVKVLKIQKSK